MFTAYDQPIELKNYTVHISVFFNLHVLKKVIVVFQNYFFPSIKNSL